MSDQIVEIKRLRGTQAQKDVSTRVPADGQLGVVTDEQYAVLGDGATAISALRPLGDRRVQTGDDTATETVSDVGPSIIAIDTTDGAGAVTLPTLSANIGRKIYIVNINAGNSITITAEGSDTIGAAGEASIDVAASVTTTIMIGTSGYWEQVATGGGGTGGGGMEIGTIYAHGGTVAPIGSFICDGTAISRTEYADLFAAIGTTWGVGDGSTTFNLPDLNGAFLRGTGSHGTETMANGSAFAGPAVGAFEDDQMQGHWHDQWAENNAFQAGVNKSGVGTTVNVDIPDGAIRSPVSDGVNGTPRTGDETRPFAAGVTYCIKATPATNSGTPLPTYSYSTGWVANSDWTNAEFTVAHGLNAPLSDLIVEFFISTDGTEENAFPVGLTDTAFNSSLSDVYGATCLAINDNSFKLQTATDGLYQILDTGGFNTIDAESYYYKVKVYRPEVLATELAVTKYDTGWTAISDWTNVAIPINHSLGTELHGLIVNMFVAEDASGTGEFQVFTNSASEAATGTTGITLNAVDGNNISFRTATNGFRYVNATGATPAVGATQTHYRVVVYAPNLLENVTPAAVKSISADYTITGRTDSPTIQATTGATDRTVTLPAGSGMVPGDEIEVSKVDAGAGKVTIARAGLDTIDGVTGVDIDSQYDLARVRWTGSYWTLVEYKDHGSNANGEWTRYVDGTMVCTDIITPATAGTPKAVVFSKTFSSAPNIITNAGGGPSSPAVAVVYAYNPLTTGFTILYVRTTGTGTVPCDYQATGRWRA